MRSFRSSGRSSRAATYVFCARRPVARASEARRRRSRAADSKRSVAAATSSRERFVRTTIFPLLLASRRAFASASSASGLFGSRSAASREVGDRAVEVPCAARALSEAVERDGPVGAPEGRPSPSRGARRTRPRPSSGRRSRSTIVRPPRAPRGRRARACWSSSTAATMRGCVCGGAGGGRPSTDGGSEARTACRLRPNASTNRDEDAHGVALRERPACARGAARTAWRPPGSARSRRRCRRARSAHRRSSASSVDGAFLAASSAFESSFSFSR